MAALDLVEEEQADVCQGPARPSPPDYTTRKTPYAALIVPHRRAARCLPRLLYGRRVSVVPVGRRTGIAAASVALAIVLLAIGAYGGDEDDTGYFLVASAIVVVAAVLLFWGSSRA